MTATVTAPAASPPPTPAPATPAPTHDFPPVQPGGSLLLAWQVRAKPILVVGGGVVAAGRILSLLNADAAVHVCAPAAGLVPEVAHRVATGVVVHHDCVFRAELLDELDPAMVLTAIDDAAASSEIYTLCHERRIPVNVADVPPECDFYFGSVHRDGPLQIMVSTNGNGPKLANIVRRRIAAGLPRNVGDAVVKVGALRKKLRRVAPRQEEGPRRMEWMTRVCEEWSLDELCRLDEEGMERVLEGWGEGRVPSYREGEGCTEGEDEDGVFREAFDGSFGWF
ncbi:hypothetical protein EDC01DRAFT_710093 [Geopyxis carbonaria]|nr:hypothetical protein EDC01DRAFT_710093 [Geopyxis carbonaria]